MEAKVDTATSAPPAQRSQHHRGAQRTDADRADDRARQRRSRDKRAAAEAEKEFAELSGETQSPHAFKSYGRK